MKKSMCVKVILSALALLAAGSSAAFSIEVCKPKMEKVLKDFYPKAEEIGCDAAFDLACIAIFGTASGEAAAIPCIVGGVVVGAFCEVHGKKFIEKNGSEVAGTICEMSEIPAAPRVPVANHLKQHEVDIYLDLMNGGRGLELDRYVHIKGKGGNWLKPGRSGVIMDKALLQDEFKGKSFLVIARIKRKGKPDIKVDIHGVTPNKHAVVIRYENGQYRLSKQELHKKTKH